MVENLLANAGDPGDAGSIPELGRSPGEVNGYPFQYSCLKNPMDRRARWATVHGAAESDAIEVTSHNTHKQSLRPVCNQVS